VDGPAGRSDLAPTIGGQSDPGVEQLHQGGDVALLGGAPESFDHRFVRGVVDFDAWRSGGDMPPGASGELAHCGGGSTDDPGDLGELHVEQVVEYPRGAFGRGEGLETTNSAKLTESSRVTWSAGSAGVGVAVSTQGSGSHGPM